MERLTKAGVTTALKIIRKRGGVPAANRAGTGLSARFDNFRDAEDCGEELEKAVPGTFCSTFQKGDINPSSGRRITRNGLNFMPSSIGAQSDEDILGNLQTSD